MKIWEAELYSGPYADDWSDAWDGLYLTLEGAKADAQANYTERHKSMSHVLAWEFKETPDGGYWFSPCEEDGHGYYIEEVEVKP